MIYPLTHRDVSKEMSYQTAAAAATTTTTTTTTEADRISKHGLGGRGDLVRGPQVLGWVLVYIYTL
jgi:hypothetical protein